MRSSTSPSLYNFFSLTKPTTGIFWSRSVPSNLAVMAVMSAAGRPCAMPGGRSSRGMSVGLGRSLRIQREREDADGAEHCEQERKLLHTRVLVGVISANGY